MGSSGHSMERCRSQTRMCAKDKNLKHHDVLSNYRHFSTAGWSPRGREAGESGSWILGHLGCCVNVWAQGSH